MMTSRHSKPLTLNANHGFSRILRKVCPASSGEDGRKMIGLWGHMIPGPSTLRWVKGVGCVCLRQRMPFGDRQERLCADIRRQDERLETRTATPTRSSATEK